MNILVVSDGYPTEEYKMSGLFQFDQAVALAEQGNNIAFFSINLRSIRKWRKWGLYKTKIKGVTVYNISLPIGAVPHQVFSNIAGMCFEMLYKRAMNDGWNFDIIHAHFWDMAYVCAKHKKAGVPLIVTEHFSGLMKDTIDPSIRNMASYAYHTADKVIAVSRQLSQVIKREFDVESIYVPNAIDNKLFKYQRRVHDDSFNIIFVGNLIPRKCPEMLIDAFYDAFYSIENNIKAKLILCGEGVCREECEAKIAKYGIQDEVKLLGMCSRVQIANVLSESDLFVLPSKAETFGVVYIEAMFCGLPVIATKCGGPEGFVNDSNGILIDVDSKEQLSQALVYMYENKHLFSRSDISIQAQKEFSAAEVAGMLESIYKNEKARCS